MARSAYISTFERAQNLPIRYKNLGSEYTVKLLSFIYSFTISCSMKDSAKDAFGSRGFIWVYLCYKKFWRAARGIED